MRVGCWWLSSTGQEDKSVDLALMPIDLENLGMQSDTPVEQGSDSDMQEGNSGGARELLGGEKKDYARTKKGTYLC